MKRTKNIAVIWVPVLIGLSFLCRTVHNTLVDEEHFLHIAHGRLEVEKQRRTDVVEKCRNAVEKYMELEGKLQSRLVTLNSAVKKGTAGTKERDELLKLLKGLDLLVEKYPALKSKKPFELLMETIQKSGLRVTMERLDYNRRIYEYNVMCRIFPYSIIARLTGFREVPFPECPPGHTGFRI